MKLTLTRVLTPLAALAIAFGAQAALPANEGFEGGALDFASSPFAWVIFHLVHNLKWVGTAVLVACTLGLAVYNRRRILMGK